MNVATSIFKMVAKIGTLVLALITIIAGFSGHIPPHIWATPAILVLLFPWLALLTLIALIAWACCKKVIPTIVCGVTLLICAGPLFNNFPLCGSKKPKPGERTFSLLTYNIYHGKNLRPQNGHGPNAPLEYILSQDADIVSLQELGSLSSKEIASITPELRQALLRKYPHHVFINNVLASAVLSKYPITLERNGTDYMLVEVNLPDMDLQLMNVHLSSYRLSEADNSVVRDIKGMHSARRSIEQLRGPITGKLKEAFRNRALAAAEVRSVINEINGPLIVAGDFNDVPSSWAYRVVRGDDLDDAYTQTGTGMMITYNMHGFYFHIDQVLYRPDPLRALSVKKQGQNTSDHYPLLCTFAY